MLEERSEQRDLCEADCLYLNHVGGDTCTVCLLSEAITFSAGSLILRKAYFRICRELAKRE